MVVEKSAMANKIIWQYSNCRYVIANRQKYVYLQYWVSSYDFIKYKETGFNLI